MSDVLPPPPPRRADDGCWKWGAIGCAGCGVLGLIAIVGLVFLLKPVVVKSLEKVQIVEKDMHTLDKALKAYSEKKGKYPSRLKELIPNFVPDSKAFHTSAEPDGPEFMYIPPENDAPGSTIILQYDLPPLVGNSGPMTVRMRKHGQVDDPLQAYGR